MINSYIDYITGVDDPKTSSDRTLFEVVSVTTLLGFIAFSITGMFVLTFYLTTLCHGETEWMAKMFVMYLASLLFNSCTYTPLKYIALGPIPFVMYATFTWGIYHCLFTNSLPTPMQSILFAPQLIFLTTCFLAGYHRDIEEDEKAGIKTIITMLGKKNSIIFLSFLALLFFVSMTFLAFYGQNNLILSTLVALPKSFKIFKEGYYSSTSQFNYQVLAALRVGCGFYIGAIGIGGFKHLI
ncbi:hypothetical protein DFA_01865 [Cavenderia fasciculata]|uniref:UbiA prenyltransferase family protein n=1 Tax=Cavenderia fasciculata TaxID=261658 RepID=F4PV71_CACFS|nr:uncharacterized protein DFA_01865 [Cavenderia fasciculata]EGG21979.1 hypothetical protein DFA_01865 [Cavenderia fasciculata]|eukprot:XP_004359830.1 hypothetical protein DFA_01865 [Cavenderia fasciculata]